MYLDKAKARFAELKPLERAGVTACTEQEVAALEQQLNVRLPGAYREFLLWMGKDGGDLLRGTDCSYEIIPKLEPWAVELLAENGLSHLLPGDAFVFLMHQGYQFMFFRLSEGEDPAVYHFDQTSHQESATTAASCFSVFLLGLIEDYAQAAQEL